MAAACGQLEKEGWEVTRLVPDGSGCVPLSALEAALRPDTDVGQHDAGEQRDRRHPAGGRGRAAGAAAGAPGRCSTATRSRPSASCPSGCGRWMWTCSRSAATRSTRPRGAGALYVKKGVRILPRAFGGGQERGLRPGTEATPAIAAFGAAAAAVPELAGQRARFEELMNRLLAGLERQEEILLHRPARHAPYILNLSVPGIRSETLLHFLAQRGVYVSSGSACSRGKSSPVLAALGLPPAEIDSALRVSLSRDNDEEDIDRFLAGVEEARAVLIRR